MIKLVISSYLLAIYLFVSELTLPFKFMLGNSQVVWVVSALVIALFIVFSKIRANLPQLVFLLLILVYLLASWFFSGQSNNALNILIDFIKFTLIPIIFFFSVKDKAALIRPFRNISILVLFILIFFSGSVSQNTEESNVFNYMEFGVGLSKCALFILISIFLEEDVSPKSKFISWLFISLIIIFSFLFANRGSLFSILVVTYLSLLLFHIRGITCRFLFIVSTLLPSFLLYFFSLEIVSYIFDSLVENDIRSYQVSKLKIALESGLSESIGARNDLYDAAMDIISSNGILPLGSSYFPDVTGFIYPHNVLLDLVINFGFPLVLLFFIFFAIKLIKIKDDNGMDFLFIIFIFSFVTLLFSQSFWVFPLFWFLPFSLLGRNVRT